MTWSEDSELELLRSFTHRWATGALRGAQRVRDARSRAATADRNFERMEEWSPTAYDVAQAYDDVWVEEHLFVLAVAQFYNWAARLVDEGSQVRTPGDLPSLAELRNTLEHLDEAALDGEYARPDPSSSKKNWSLSKLPAGQLFLGTRWGSGSPAAFGILDVDVVERECRRVLDDILDERVAPHIDWYTQMIIDRERGK